MKLTSAALLQLLTKKVSCSSYPVILCIGSDRIIGDCLGPVTGSLLVYRCSLTPHISPVSSDRLSVYGTLSAPVHALNLDETLLEIKKKHPHRPVIAVDASLGSVHHIGTTYVRSGCLQPGAGVRKHLPHTGDISITGIAAPESTQPYLSLQTAQLSVITKMADYISQCILEACASLEKTKAFSDDF